MKKALVTLAIGKRYEILFDKYCRPLWSEYASKHGFDIIVHNQPLDTSERSQSRSPSWQKCLILSGSEVQKYDQVVWVDSDILINPNAPNIVADVPIERVGAVDEYSIPTKEDYTSYLTRIYDRCKQKDINCIENLTATDFHHKYGFEGEFEGAVQAGVMVVSPRYHKELFEHVYHKYEDKGNRMNYEMRPLSYEILTKNNEYWLTPKFNMIWPYMKEFVYPCLRPKRSIISRVQAKLNIEPRALLFRQCVTTAYLNNYFLHFSGGSTVDMKYVDIKINSIYDL